MPAVQSTYTATIRAGLEGMVATEWGNSGTRESRIVEGTAGIGFGRVVSKGTGTKGAVLGGALVDMVGVSIRDVTLIAQIGQTVDLYQNRDNMGVLNEGDIWVVTKGAAVTAGNVVTYDSTDGRFAPATGTAIPGSRWLTSAASGALACARLTRPYHTT
jgi:hypothetical protein